MRASVSRTSPAVSGIQSSPPHPISARHAGAVRSAKWNLTPSRQGTARHSRNQRSADAPSASREDIATGGRVVRAPEKSSQEATKLGDSAAERRNAPLGGKFGAGCLRLVPEKRKSPISEARHLQRSISLRHRTSSSLTGDFLHGLPAPRPVVGGPGQLLPSLEQQSSHLRRRAVGSTRIFVIKPIRRRGRFAHEFESLLILVSHRRLGGGDHFNQQPGCDQRQRNKQERHHATRLAGAMPAVLGRGAFPSAGVARWRIGIVCLVRTPGWEAGRAALPADCLISGEPAIPRDKTDWLPAHSFEDECCRASVQVGRNGVRAARTGPRTRDGSRPARSGGTQQPGQGKWTYSLWQPA